MITDRFYNYDDALDGLLKHLALTPEGKDRNIAFLVTEGGKPVEAYNPKLHTEAKTWLEDHAHMKNVSNRSTFLQEYFNVHFYYSESPSTSKLNLTVVMDSLTLGTAAGTLHVIQDHFVRSASARGLTLGTVFIFAVEASLQ